MTQQPFSASPGWSFNDSAEVARSIIEATNASLRESVRAAYKWSAFPPPEPIVPLDFFADIQRQRQQRLPQNWPVNPSPKLWATHAIVQSEGIPLTYVPRPDIVAAVLAAANREDRVAILVSRQDEVLEDCDEALTDGLHWCVKDQVPLVREAIATYRAGHVAAAQALTVVACDTLIGANLAYTHASARKVAAKGDLKLAMLADLLRMELALAPVVKLLTDWSLASGNPEPTELSRHVTVHHATTAHLRADNALIAIMLATGLICALDELQGVRGSPVDGSQQFT